MKKLSLLTLCLIAFIGIVSAQQTQKEAAPNRYGWSDTPFSWGCGFGIDLYGDVQCVRIKEGDDHKEILVTYGEFNDKGDLVYGEVFEENDRGKVKLCGFQRYEYNDSGNIVKAKAKWRIGIDDGSGPWRRMGVTFEHNNNNKLIYMCEDWGVYKEKYRYFYDNNGNEILESWYDNKDNLTGFTIYTYDSNNNLVSECEFDENHNLVSRFDYIYEYDGNNNLCEKKAYKDGIICEHIVYYTDGKQTKKEESLYNNQGKLYLRYKYNSMGDTVESRRFYNYYSTQPANEIITWEHEYDSRNNLVKTTEYTRKNEEETPRLYWVFENEYDSHNNIVKTTKYDYSNNAESPEVSYVEYEITYR